MARYALVIGISKYKSRQLADLSKPEKDAKAIAEVLHEYGQFDTKPTVLAGEVTQSQLVDTLKTFLKKQAANSEAFIYFTGHGISVRDPFGDEEEEEGCLATSDTTVKTESGKVVEYGRAIPFSKLNALIQKANLSSLVMMVDACHSGDFIDKAAYEQSFLAFNNKSDCLLISACRDFEEALAKKSEDHSLFTSAVLSALVPEKADSQGAITSGRLADELKLTLKGSPQKPEAFGKGLGLKIIEFPPGARVSAATSKTEKDSAVQTTKLFTVPLQMPPLPDHFVERPYEQQRVKEDLLCEGTKAGTLVVSAIYGLGGIGKSVLAAKLAREPEIQRYFSDGILWVTLGQNPDVLPLLSGWIQALGDTDYKPTAIESASNHLRTLLYDKHVLLVVDDVWNPEHLEPFRVGGEGSCVLVTTREARISDAHRHEIGVMSPAQSLELMTQKLSEPLSDSAKQQVLSFSERVGYLPLALELAASQIEDGVTWQELLDDFKQEVVRLETLDIYGQTEMPDEEKRRKYSLRACFNLSLRQLSQEQLRQFAWLGVVPEDVSLTQEMAETLWQVTSRQAGAILRSFRAKALVLQSAKQADERPSYRMHDLMHDLAQSLLTSPPQSMNVGELPGLGLTKAEAHSELLERYCKQTQRGQWHTLKDDGYIYAALTWHMEQARQPEMLHQLLQLSNDIGSNGWYESCESIGRLTGFVNDVGRAWWVAIEAHTCCPKESAIHLLRYVFIYASMNSYSSKVPIELLELLVRKGAWQPAQGLAYAQQIQEPWQRSKCISRLSPYIPNSLLSEVLSIVEQIREASYRSYVLNELTDRFPEIWPDVLSAVRQIYDRYGGHRQKSEGFSHKALAIKEIAAHLPEEHFPDAISIARKIKDDSDKALALSALAEHHAVSWMEALSVASGIRDELARSQTLLKIGNGCSEVLLEVLSVARTIKNKSLRSTTIVGLLKSQDVLGSKPSRTSIQISPLLKLLKQHPGALSEILSTIREIEDRWDWLKLMIEIAKQYPEILSEILSTIREMEDKPARLKLMEDKPARLKLMIELAKQYPESRSEVLTEICKIEDESARLELMIGLVKQHPEILSEILSKIHKIEDESSRLKLMIGLVKQYPKARSELLSEIRKNKSSKKRSQAISQILSPRSLSPQGSLEEALNIEEESTRSRRLFTLLKQYPELLSDTLSAICEIKSISTRSHTLIDIVGIDIAEHHEEVLSEAITTTRRIKKKSTRLKMLSKLAKYSPEVSSEVLNSIRMLKKESMQVEMLLELTNHCPELIPEITTTNRITEKRATRSRFLIELVISRMGVSQKLSKQFELSDHYDDVSWSLTPQLDDLIELASHYPEILSTLLEGIYKVNNGLVRSKALLEVAKQCPSIWVDVLTKMHEAEGINLSQTSIELASHHPGILSNVLAVVDKNPKENVWMHELIERVKFRPEVWIAAAKIVKEKSKESIRPLILIELSKRDSEVWPEALVAVQTIKNDLARSRMLIELSKCDSEVWPEILSTVQEMKDDLARSRTLIELSKYNSEVWPEALAAVQTIKDEYFRSRTLIEIAEFLPKPLLSESLDLVRGFEDESTRSDILIKLAAHLPKSFLSKSLRVTREIKDAYSWSIALGKLARYLPVLWPEAIDSTREIGSEEQRSYALIKLVDAVPESLLPEVLKVAQEIDDNLYQSRPLIELAKHLPDLWSEVLQVVRKISSEDYRSRALITIAKYMPETVLLEELKVARELLSESGRSHVLTELVRYLPTSSLSAALEMAQSIDSIYYRSRVLIELSHRSSGFLPEAIRLVHDIKPASIQIRSLTELSKYYPEVWPEALTVIREIPRGSFRSRSLAELIMVAPQPLLSEALDATREFHDDSSQSCALVQLVEYLPKPLLTKALTMSRSLEQTSCRSSVLIAMAKRLPNLWSEALETTQAIEDEYSRSSMLIAMAKRLPNLWSEALETTQAIEDEYSRSTALIKLADELPKSMFPEVLSAIRDIKDESYRSSALIEISKHLPDLLLLESLTIIREIQDRYHRANSLQGFLPYLNNISISSSVWNQILEELTCLTRDCMLGFLADCSPTLLSLYGEETVVKALQVIRSVRKQWA